MPADVAPTALRASRTSMLAAYGTDFDASWLSATPVYDKLLVQPLPPDALAAETHAALGAILQADWDSDGAERCYRRALVWDHPEPGAREEGAADGTGGRGHRASR